MLPGILSWIANPDISYQVFFCQPMVAEYEIVVWIASAVLEEKCCLTKTTDYEAC